jgi:ATP-binding cassette subfamily B (MDR/TAP) protein 1
MLDSLNSPGESFQSVVNRLCLFFVYLGMANLFSGYMQVTCWTMTGERQTQKYRETYVKAILSQEIGWFDECGANTLATQAADLSGKVEDGLGRQTGDMLQYIVQALSAYIIAFYLSWRLTLVLICILPFIAFSGKPG